MRISLCNEVIAQLDFPRQCALAAALGYDGLEIAPYTLTDDPTRLTAAQVAELRRAASDAGIAITGLHYLMRAPARLSITATDAAVRARSVEIMRQLCGLCAKLGGTILVHGSPEQRVLGRGDEENGRKRGAECFAAVADAAADAHVTYCIEPLARNLTGFVNTVAQAAAIVNAIGNPALRTHDRLLRRRPGRSRTGRCAGAALAAEWADRAHAFQRSEPARTGRRRLGVCADPFGAARGRLYGRRLDRAVRVPAGRAHLRCARHRLHPRHSGNLARMT